MGATAQAVHATVPAEKVSEPVAAAGKPAYVRDRTELDVRLVYLRPVLHPLALSADVRCQTR